MYIQINVIKHQSFLFSFLFFFFFGWLLFTILKPNHLFLLVGGFTPGKYVRVVLLKQ